MKKPWVYERVLNVHSNLLFKDQEIHILKFILIDNFMIIKKKCKIIFIFIYILSLSNNNS